MTAQTELFKALYSQCNFRNQTHAGEVLGFHASNVSNLLNGKYEPMPGTLALMGVMINWPEAREYVEKKRYLSG